MHTSLEYERQHGWQWWALWSCHAQTQGSTASMTFSPSFPSLSLCPPTIQSWQQDENLGSIYVFPAFAVDKLPGAGHFKTKFLATNVSLYMDLPRGHYGMYSHHPDILKKFCEILWKQDPSKPNPLSPVLGEILLRSLELCIKHWRRHSLRAGYQQ